MSETATQAQTARCGVDVVAGVLPGQPMAEYTRQWFISSEEWSADKGKNQATLLSDLAGRATAWGTYLMLQPDRVNWVKVEWIWF
jgi:lysophospholipase L1-like esterase